MKLENRLKKQRELEKKLNKSMKKSILNLKKMFENSTEDQLIEKLKLVNNEIEKRNQLTL